MDYRKSAQEVLDNIGGADNVVSAAHCATRLRLVIADNAKVNKEAIENVDGAKGVFEAQGQLQIIFGTGTVNKVYEEFIALSGVEAATKAEVKEAAAQQQNIFMRAIKMLGDVFVPIIPAIVASGLLLGIMSALNFMASNGFIALDTNIFIYKIADLVSGTSFGILQILIGYSAAKAFGANPYLGAVVGGAFINSSLQSAYTVASEGVRTMVTVIPGVYSFEWVGYQGHVIPIVIACAILAFLEKRLHKIVPEMFDLFVTPLVSVFVTVLVTLVAVGPIFVWGRERHSRSDPDPADPALRHRFLYRRPVLCPHGRYRYPPDVHRHRLGSARPVRCDLLAAHRQRCQHRSGWRRARRCL